MKAAVRCETSACASFSLAPWRRWRLVHIAQLARGHQLAAQLAQLGERITYSPCVPSLRRNCLSSAVAAGHLAHGLRRGLADALDLFVFVDHRIARGDDASSASCMS
jgi:hypothetical protein